jgi:diacylglycerol kinase family enzyme
LVKTADPLLNQWPVANDFPCLPGMPMVVRACPPAEPGAERGLRFHLFILVSGFAIRVSRFRHSAFFIYIARMAGSPTILIFANPNAGRGLARKWADRIARRLADDGFIVRMVLEQPSECVPEPQADYRAAVVIGGDGTLRAVAERLYAVFTDPPPLVLVPMGTANLIGKHLALPWRHRDPVELVARAIAGGKVVRLDAGQANGHLFLLMASAGFDAQVVHEMQRVRNGPIDFLSYAIPTLLTFHRYTFPSLQVKVDGKVAFPFGQAIAIVANVPEYGVGFPFLPGARPNDRLLDVCVLPCKNRKDLLHLTMLAAAGEHLQMEGAVLASGTEITIESPEPTPIQVDGDAFGHTPLEIQLLPRTVGFIVAS